MRLVCPNCGAQYEVDDRVIPESGRDVQCSACGHAWYQMPPALLTETEEVLPPEHDELLTEAGEDEEPVTEGEAEEAVAATAEAAAPQEAPARRELDEGIRSILREEAEQEMARRAADRVETQPDLGLEAGPSPEEERRRVARERIARMRGLDEEDLAAEAEIEAPPQPQPAEDRKQTPRRDLFPDIEEINSTLDSHDFGAEKAGGAVEAARAGGFGRGFFLMIFLAALLLALYLLAPNLARTVPLLEPALMAYVDAVNAARAWLDDALRSVTSMVEGLAGQE